MSEYQNILLPVIPILKESETDDGNQQMLHTGKMLPYLLEEFISRGVFEISIIDSWRYEDIIPNLSSTFNKHLVKVDDGEKYNKIAVEIFSPFFEEYDLEGDLSVIKSKRKLSEDESKVLNTAFNIMNALPGFIFACKNKTTVHIDIYYLNKLTESLLKDIKSPEMRARLATLKGIFSSYNNTEHDSPIIYSRASEDAAKLFAEFCEDANFQAMSREIRSLGFADKLVHSIPSINKAVRELFLSKSGRKLIDYGSKTVTVATGIPIPDSSLGESLLKENYLPPVVDLRIPISRAYLNYLEHNPGDKIMRMKSDIWRI